MSFSDIFIFRRSGCHEMNHPHGHAGWRMYLDIVAAVSHVCSIFHRL